MAAPKQSETTGLRERPCEQTRAWAALAPDGELAVLERRLLDAHLAHCAACHSFAGDVARIAAVLRRLRPGAPRAGSSFLPLRRCARPVAGSGRAYRSLMSP